MTLGAWRTAELVPSIRRGARNQEAGSSPRASAQSKLRTKKSKTFTKSIRMGTNSSDKRSTDSSTAKANTFSTIAATTKAAGKTTWCMERASFISPTERSSMRASGSRTSLTAGAFTTLTKPKESRSFGRSTKGSFERGKWTAGEN